jgi:hypothetical protein
LLEAEPVEPPLQPPPVLQDGVYVLSRVAVPVPVSDARPGDTSRVFGNGDLHRYAEQRSPETPDAPPSEQQAATSRPFSAPGDGSESSDDARRHAALKSHLASAETYLKQSEARLKSAQELWQLATRHANQGVVIDEARRRLERTKKALERAQGYRESAEAAARRGGVPPG